LFPLGLPEEPAVFRAFVGLRDGSKSTGVEFVVELNGQVLARKMVLPGKWHDLEADLSPWRGQTVVLVLTTDSAGSYYFDWAHWGEPLLTAKPVPSPSPPPQ
ncbi:MAG: NPCBM/NEW2 domain-containing protein, partial [Thermoguttaceae bacterium]